MAAHDLVVPSAARAESLGLGADSGPRFGALVRCAPVFAVLLLMTALTGDPAPGEAWTGRLVQHVPLGWLPANVALLLARPWMMFVVWCVGVLAAVRARNWTLVMVAVFVLVALSVNPILKEVFARPRPGAGDLLIRRAADGYGFPSGHTSSATLMYGYAAFALALATPPRIGRLCIATACAAIGVIAFERVYDGAHWPSDVAGGFTSGILLLAGCVTLGAVITSRILGYRRHPTRAPIQTAVERPGTTPLPAHTRTFTDPVERSSS